MPDRSVRRLQPPANRGVSATMREPLPIASRIKNAVRIDRAIRFVWRASAGLTVVNALLVIVQGGLPILSLYLIKLIIDTISAAIRTGTPEQSTTTLFMLIGLAAGVALLQAGLSRLAHYTTEAQSVKVTDYVYETMHRKSMNLDLAYYENPAYYDSLHRAQQEGPYRPTKIVNGLNRLGQSGISLLAMVGLLLTFHWLVGVLLIVSTIPGLIVQILYSRKRYEWERKRTKTERRAKYFSWVLTADTFAKELRLFGTGAFFAGGFNALRGLIRNEKLSLERQRTLADFLAQAFATIVLMGCFLVIGLRALQGAITLGDMVMFFQAFQRGIANLKELLQTIAGLYEDNLFITHFFAFLDVRNEIDEPAHPRPLPAAREKGLELSNVCFKYPGERQPVLNDVSFSIAPGEVVALVGANGAGKSTLVKLLCRLYDPQQGTVSLEGIPLPQLSLQDVRTYSSAVFQDFVKYHLTARENIWLGDTTAPPDSAAIIEAARKAGADEMLSTLPHGYDTVLGRWFTSGEELSHGEWQKIVLARAFFRDSRLIILDEPTSSLDADTEYYLYLKFRELIAGRSALLISHRFSTVTMADTIYVLEGGRIIEQGSHNHLLARAGRYADMYQKQAAWVTS